MKKLTIVAALAAAVATALAAPDARTAEEYRAVAGQMMATTNHAERLAIAASNQFWTIVKRLDLAALRLEIDREFAARGVDVPWAMSATWPEASAAVRARKGVDYLPVLTALAAKYGVNMNVTSLHRAGATPEEIMSVVDESLRATAGGKFPALRIPMALAGFQKAAVGLVKKHLRRQGRSFITKDGVNPCAEYMERLNAAVNAPRFAGLNEWLAETGVQARISVDVLPSEEAVEALKTALLDGEKPMTEHVTRLLSICLGTDGYNAFVREYNGEK